MRRLIVIPGLLALLMAATPAVAQDEPETAPRREATGVESGDDVPSPTREEILRRNREIWERMTPEERKRTLERLKRFQKMSEARRKRLLEKARRLVGKLDRETREQLAKKKRREQYRRVYQDMKVLLGKVRKRLPDDLEAKLESLDRHEQHMIERHVLSRLFEAQAEIARKSFTAKEIERLTRAARSDRHRYMNLLFEIYKKKIFEDMSEQDRARLAALPKAEQKKARREHAKSVIGRKMVGLVARIVVPDLRQLLDLPEKERRKLIGSRLRGDKAARRGPRGFHGRSRLSREEQEKLRKMSDEEKRTYFEERRRQSERRIRRHLEKKGLTSEEIDALMKLPPHKRWRELHRTHPELFEGASRRQRKPRDGAGDEGG